MCCATNDQGQIQWAYAGLREWVQQIAPHVATQSGQPASPLGQALPAQQPARAGVAGFVLALVGFLVPLLWIAGLILSWRDVKRARRERLPHGLAMAGLIISSIGVGLLVVGIVAAMAIPMFLGQRDKANEAAVKEGVHSVQIGVQSWAVDHGDTYPDASQVSMSDLTGYVDIWPTNPYTGLPMSQGSAAGDFSYAVGQGGTSFRLTGYGQGGAIITVP